MIRRVVAVKRDLVNTPAEPAIAPPRLPVADAYAWCERMVRERTENFPVASRFVPAHLRPHVWAIYAFARTADDYADEPRYAGRRHELLDAWEEQLERAFHGEASHPIFVALRDTIERRDIPMPPLAALLTALRMDLSSQRHPTWESVRSYCEYSAASVGRLVLYVFDYRDPSLQRFSDDLCTALHLTNFLQDVGRDWARGRLYLPEEDLQHFGVSEADLAAGIASDPFREMMRFQVARARALFERGRPLADRVGRDLSFELHLILEGGFTLLDKIESVRYDVFTRRPSLTRLDKARMLARSAAHRFPRIGSP